MLLFSGNCDDGYDYIGRQFVILFMENEVQDMELELHYADQDNQGSASVTISSPQFTNTQLPRVITLSAGGEFKRDL